MAFTGTADDAEEGDISSSISWTSDIDGDFGTGSPITAVLGVGTHLITATATDSGGKSGSDTITVTIKPVSGNVPPNANFSFDTAKLRVAFTDLSNDSDGRIVSWVWNFGDGKTSEVQNPRHRFRSGGDYTVELTVTDDDGATGSMSQDVTVTK